MTKYIPDSDNAKIILREFKSIAPYASFGRYVQSVQVTKTDQDKIQVVIKFPNNYGASVIYGYGSRGVELAVIHYNRKGTWNIDYTTPITNDVLGYLDKDGLLDTLQEIEELPIKRGVLV